jgi:signal transduction histidine kinase
MSQERAEGTLRDEELRFRPRARMLLLLGEQLIRDPGIAVFELVKNAYDADATDVSVCMTGIDRPEDSCVVVEDNGSGMTWETVTQVWLEPGTDNRRKEKASGVRSPKFHRLALGEKGIGRFAAHKLGLHVQVVTRAAGGPEVLVDLDWRKFETDSYLDETPVRVMSREPVHFTGEHTGTRIQVTVLGQPWTRGMVRQVHRAVTAISSPFHGPSDFAVSFEVHPHEEWVAGLLDLASVMEFAPYAASCRIDDGVLTYDYAFTPPTGMTLVEPREVRGATMQIQAELAEFSTTARKALGPFTIDFRLFDLDAHVLRFGVTDPKGLREFLRNNGGVRVFRDGIRVFDYGEPGNDWLSLGTRRVNIPTRRLSNNQIIAAVRLDGVSSAALIEKTNREGFVEDETYEVFRTAVFMALLQIEAERNRDKTRIRRAYDGKAAREPVIENMAQLREELHARSITELDPMLDTIEREFREVRDTLMTAASSGLMVATIIHEVEKGIDQIVSAVRRGAERDDITPLADHLSELIQGLTNLTRKSSQKTEKASNLIRQAIFNTGYRARAHKIKVLDGIEIGDQDFSAECSRRLIIATLMNLFDNSIYWLDNKGAQSKVIYIGTTFDLPGGPAIVVADNGPGFRDPPEYLTQPFAGRRPDGMGIGLHLASDIMRAQGGHLVFPDKGDVRLPPEVQDGGAVVALQFKP